MAYNFSAEKHGARDLRTLHERLSRFELVELFPVEVGGDSLTLGMSIPFKAMDDPRFRSELENVMTYLVVEQGFHVTDLYTGEPVSVGAISGLAKQISA